MKPALSPPSPPSAATVAATVKVYVPPFQEPLIGNFMKKFQTQQPCTLRCTYIITKKSAIICAKVVVDDTDNNKTVAEILRQRVSDLHQSWDTSNVYPLKV
jgi:hypothetical protein